MGKDKKEQEEIERDAAKESIEAADTFLDAIEEVLGPFKWIVKFFRWLIDVLLAIWEEIEDLWKEIEEIYERYMRPVIDWLKGKIDWIIGWLDKIVTYIHEKIDWIYNKLFGWIEKIRKTIDEIGRKLSRIVGVFLPKLGEEIDKTREEILRIIDKYSRDLRDWALDKLRQTIRPIQQGLYDIRGALKELGEKTLGELEQHYILITGISKRPGILNSEPFVKAWEDYGEEAFSRFADRYTGPDTRGDIGKMEKLKESWFLSRIVDEAEMYMDMIEKSWVDDLLENFGKNVLEAWDEIWFKKMMDHGLTDEDIEKEEESPSLFYPDEIYWQWLKMKGVAA